MLKAIPLNYKKNLLYIFALFCALILESVPRLFEIGGTKPLLTLTVALTVSLYEDEICAGLFAVLTGVFLDLSSPTFFGFNGIILCVLIVCFCNLRREFFLPSIGYYLSSLMITVFSFLSAQFVFVYGIWKLPGLAHLYSQKVLYTTLYTALCATAVYFIFKKINRYFTQMQKEF